jgi:HTH-type transcriptional regulator, competence development regulator
MLQADRMKTLRQQKRLTQDRFAELLGTNIRMIARYEAGETDPAGDVIARMADIFEVSADYLLGRTDNPAPCDQPKDLNLKEQQILAALRRGDALEAIRWIVTE